MYSLLVRYGTENLLYLVASPHLVVEMEDITMAHLELKVVLVVVAQLLVVPVLPPMEILGEHLIVIHQQMVGEIVEHLVTQHHAVVAVAVLELLPLETTVVLV
jgi:hypothetical protein